MAGEKSISQIIQQKMSGDANADRGKPADAENKRRQCHGKK
jgi:hypothetical protein